MMMSSEPDPPSCPFDAREREFIRREFGYISASRRIWPTASCCAPGGQGRRRTSEAATGSAEHDRLVELRSGPRGVRGFFTAAGIAAKRQFVADRRLMNPKTFAHLRLELGLDEAGQAAAE